MSFSKITFNTQHKLNTALCQFTSSASKTQKAIEYIKHFSILSRLTRGEIENGVHHMTIILTNNNLLETTQWRHRLVGRTKDINMKICTLSSKKNSTFQSISQLSDAFFDAKNASDLPDILVMCTHGARISDVISWFKRLKTNRLSLTDIGIHQITATVMFDEADKNIDLIADFLKDVQTHIENAETVNTVLRDTHFITATPCKKFWKKLKKLGIKELDNINHYLRDENVLNINHEDLYKDYRKLSDHCINTVISDLTCNPVCYAEQVVKEVTELKLSERATRLIDGEKEDSMEKKKTEGYF
jgi:uncharacterized protein YecE (DUF72 family)